MKLWRLTREEHSALDGQGAFLFGGRYSSPGQRIVNFTSEAALAVLIALRYHPSLSSADEHVHILGWTEVFAEPERVPEGLTDQESKAFVDDWAGTQRSLLLVLSSAVLPEADIVLMNAAHSEATHVPALTSRPFRFTETLHLPPILRLFGKR